MPGSRRPGPGLGDGLGGDHGLEQGHSLDDRGLELGTSLGPGPARTAGRRCASTAWSGLRAQTCRNRKPDAAFTALTVNSVKPHDLFSDRTGTALRRVSDSPWGALGLGNGKSRSTRRASPVRRRPGASMLREASQHGEGGCGDRGLLLA